MNYSITCTCGQKVAVSADSEESAVHELVRAMDAHLGASEHADVPKDMDREQKERMVRSKMKQE
jgi:hypothetical protein